MDHPSSDTASWQQLGSIAPNDLVDARLRLHWAAQPVAALSTSLNPAEDDDSHTNLGWLTKHGGALAGRPVAGPRPHAAALRLADATVLQLDADQEVMSELPLDGQTAAYALQWLSEEYEVVTGQAPPAELRWSDYDMPKHPNGDGAPFALDGPRFAEISRWFGNAAAVLDAVAAGEAGASEVRCWPHHFDIATLITVSGSGESAKTIGVGLSPGDESTHPEPYWYVNLWPHPPADAALPELPAGGWHREGWTGAVLTGSDVVAAGDGAAQLRRTEAFLDAAIAACRGLLG